MGGRSVGAKEIRSYYAQRKEWSSVTNASQVFKETNMQDEFNPAKIKLPREACDSPDSPHSRGIIFAEDVTGSMGFFLLDLITKQFPRLITSTYSAVSYNPHIMFMGVGDVEFDEAPLQVTQFEADLRMLDQLQKIWLEKRGGYNNYESYILPWYFAAKCIKMDCYDKRGEKGFLFTFGDEYPTPYITSRSLKKVFGENLDLSGEPSQYTNLDLLEMAEEKFYCYHVILQGNGYSSGVVNDWKQLMGSHALDLTHHEFLPELVTSVLKMYEGVPKADVINGIEDVYARDVVSHALETHEEIVKENAVSIEQNAQIDVF